MSDDYLEFLRSYDGIDKFILFALWLCVDWSVQDIAEELGTTRQTIYNTIERHREIYNKYIKERRDEL